MPASLPPVNLTPTGLTQTGGSGTFLPSYTDLGRHIFGQEYLGAFWSWYRNNSLSGLFGPLAVLSGDSTMVGAGIGNAAYQPATILPTLAAAKGFPIQVVNRAVSGKTSQHWLNTYLPADLAAYPTTSAPALYIFNWGMNDPDFADTGQTITVAQTVANYRTGLAQIRATSGWSANNVSILVLSPNTANDDPHSRNEAWREQVMPGIKQACRDYGACFIDVYALFRESRANLTTAWLDTPYSDYRHIHPREDMGLAIWGVVADVLFPGGLCAMLGASVFRNISGAVTSWLPTTAPNAMPLGKTVYRAQGGNSWPFDGFVETTAAVDSGYCLQTNFGPSGVAFRTGSGTTWGAWLYLTPTLINVTPAAGYTLATAGDPPMATTLLSSGLVIAEGYINQTTSGVIASGATVATVATAHRPTTQRFTVPLAFYTGTLPMTTGFGSVTAAGALTLNQSSPASTARVYFGSGALWVPTR